MAVRSVSLTQSLIRPTRICRTSLWADTIRPRQVVLSSGGIGFNNSAMLIAANALRAAILYAQIHFGDPSLTGMANSNSVARVAITWTPVTGNGDLDLASPLVFTGIVPFTPCTWISLWGAAIGGTTYGNFPLTTALIADGGGGYTLNALPIDGSAR
jgi:hypothetical protein